MIFIPLLFYIFTKLCRRCALILNIKHLSGPGQVASSRTARCAVSGSSQTGVLVRPTQPSTLKREENEYVQSVAESEIHFLDNCEVPCYGHARWHSRALLGSSRPGSAWLPNKGMSSYLLAYPFRFFGLGERRLIFTEEMYTIP